MICSCAAGTARRAPSQVQHHLRPRRPNRLDKQAHVLMHPVGVLDRQRALFLEDDAVEPAALDLPQRRAGVEVASNEAPPALISR